MIENASGVVLRLRRLTETSLIVHWLARDQGRIATVAKGALRPKSPFRGKLDLFYYADFTFTRSRRSELHTLGEVSLRETHPGLRTSIESLQQASHGAALIEIATETDTPLGSIYDLVMNFLRRIESSPRPESILSFELRLLHELGFAPDWTKHRLSPGTTGLAQSLLSAPDDLLNRIQGTDAQLKELSRFLHIFLVNHLEKVPKGRDTALGLG